MGERRASRQGPRRARGPEEGAGGRGGGGGGEGQPRRRRPMTGRARRPHEGRRRPGAGGGGRLWWRGWREGPRHRCHRTRRRREGRGHQSQSPTPTRPHPERKEARGEEPPGAGPAEEEGGRTASETRAATEEGKRGLGRTAYEDACSSQERVRAHRGGATCRGQDRRRPDVKSRQGRALQEGEIGRTASETRAAAEERVEKGAQRQRRVQHPRGGGGEEGGVGAESGAPRGLAEKAPGHGAAGGQRGAQGLGPERPSCPWVEGRWGG